jgi:hypothetical protein
VPSIDYTPSLEDIGAADRARTRDSNGNALGTFTSDTMPDGVSVNTLIQNAVGFIEGFAEAGGVTIEARCAPSAKQAIIYRVAMGIELDFFPEQIVADNSPYDEYKALYEAAINQLARCLGINNPDDGPATGNEDEPETALPLFGFPTHVQGLTSYLEHEEYPYLIPGDVDYTVPDEVFVTDPVRVTEVGNGTIFVGDRELIIKRAPVNVTNGTDRVVVAAVTGKKIRVIWANALAGATNAQLTFKTKGAGTGTPISPLYDNGSHGGFVFGRDPNGIFETNVGEALTVDANATIGLMVGYLEV